MDYNDFSRAIALHTPQLMGHALKFTGNEDDAKDLLQETLIKGFRFANSFNDGTNIRGWLYVIMKNTYINHFRRNIRKNDLICTEDKITDSQLVVNASDNAASTTFAMEDISKAMRSIKKEYRIPFQRYFEGYKYEEIAVELKIPVGTVKTRIYQARISLKKYLAIYKT